MTDLYRVLRTHCPIDKLSRMVFRQCRQYRIMCGHHQTTRGGQSVANDTSILVTQEHCFDGIGAVEDFIDDEKTVAGGGGCGSSGIGIRNCTRVLNEFFNPPDLRLEQRFSSTIVDRVQIPTKRFKRCPSHRCGTTDPPRLSQQHIQQQGFQHSGFATGIAAGQHRMPVEC